MSITREITAEDWGKLNNDDQSLYEADGDKYKFIGVNPSKMLKAKQHEKERATKASQSLAALQKQFDELQEAVESKETATTTHQSEIDKLNKKITALKEEHAQKLAASEQALRDTELRRVIAETASKAFPAEHALVGQMILRDRLAVDIQDGKARVRVKARDGEFSDTMEVADLIKDLGSDDRFKQYTMAAGQSSGTGGIEQGMGAPESDQFAKSGSLQDALKDVDIATLKPEQIETLVGKFGTEEPLEQFRR